MNKSEQIKADLYAQKPRRINHIEGVYECALELRDTHFPELTDEKIAEAAYMHDFTKEWSAEKQLELMAKYGVKPDAEGLAEKLFHARTAALLAKHIYNLSDDVCSAIYYHTTGRAHMTLLEKIIYIADYIEPNRDFEGVEELRRLAYEDLDRALLLGVETTIQEMWDRRLPIHTNTLRARDWLREHGTKTEE